MKYIREFGIIVLVSFLGEILHELIPLPVPASIYGLVLMLAGLLSGVIPHEHVKRVGHFLVDTMAIMFLPAAVELMEATDILRPVLVPYAVITVVSLVVVMAVSGKVTQMIMDHGKPDEEADD